MTTPSKSPKFLKKSGELNQLRDRYFGHVDRLTSDDTQRFIERMRTVLPQYRPHFLEAQIETGIDWRLLAALAYQESRWNPVATSPTGVRGMMMLTAETADHMGIDNRLDAAQSIDAARARTALDRARGFIVQASDVPQHSPGREDVERSL